TLLISAGTGILFGFIPAFQYSRADLSTVLKESSGRSGTGLRQNKARSLLVVMEIAMAVILLVGCALLIRTEIALRDINPGFDPHNVLTMRMSLSTLHLRTCEALQLTIRAGTDRLRALPGVEAAAASCCLPLGRSGSLPFRVVGRPITGSIPFHGF